MLGEDTVTQGGGASVAEVTDRSDCRRKTWRGVSGSASISALRQGDSGSTLTTLVSWTLDIPPCLDSELTEFPLRMRDWLKNVLVTLYERDEDNNLLTEKQKLRVSSLLPACPRDPGWPRAGWLLAMGWWTSTVPALELGHQAYAYIPALPSAFILGTRTQTSHCLRRLVVHILILKALRSSVMKRRAHFA